MINKLSNLKILSNTCNALIRFSLNFLFGATVNKRYQSKILFFLLFDEKLLNSDVYIFRYVFNKHIINGRGQSGFSAKQTRHNQF